MIFIFSLFAYLAKAEPLAETFEELEKEIFNRMSEMDIDIFKDFKEKYKCDNCDSQTFWSLLREFESFKRVWIDQMVDFVINKMRIDA